MNKRKAYFWKQKLMGLALIVLGVISAIILDGDITAALFICPIGLYAMFTKEKVLLSDYLDEGNDKDEEL